MKPRLLGSLLLMSLGAWSPTGAQQQPGRDRGAAAERRGWHTDLDEAGAEARRLDRPLMVVLRCGP